MAIPALLSKKTGRPVMMRISREEETYIGRMRPGFQARVKIGFRRDGRITALDLFIIEDSGPYERQADNEITALIASLLYQPMALRFRGLSVATNTPPRCAQRGPGGMQGASMIEPLISRAARQLGVDEVAIRKINAPSDGSLFGITDTKDRPRKRVATARVREALDRGAELFNWQERQKHNGERRGSKVRGVSAIVGAYVAGSVGFDGLLVIKTDGKVYVHQGIGNLGTHSVMDTARAAGEVLGPPWENYEIVWGNTANALPWSSQQDGSQTTHAHTRANFAAALDAKRKLQEIAAHDLGGAPEGYDVSNGRVYQRVNPGRTLTFAQAAARAIALGGKYDGHYVSPKLHPMTIASVHTLAGQGLIGVAKDEFPHQGDVWSFIAAFAEVEVDTETGESRILEYLPVADVGTVLHPRSLGAQLHGGGIQGFGHARTQNIVLRADLREADLAAALSEQASHDPRHAAGAAVGGREHSRSEQSGRCEGRRRSGGSGRQRRGAVRHSERHWESLCAAHAGDPRPCPRSARRKGCASRAVDDIRLRRIMAVIHDVMPAFLLLQPGSLADARKLLEQHGADAWILAGGLDSFDWLKDRMRKPKAVIDLSGVQELKGVRNTSDGIEIGAMTTLTEVANHPLIQQKYRVLAEGAEAVASPQIRNQATIGGNVSQDARCWYYRAGWPCYRASGNICYADTPDGRNREHAILHAERCVAVNPSDTAPALIALDARFVLQTAQGERVISAEDYFVGPDIDITRLTILRPGDLLSSIRIPATWAGAQFYFEKIRDRQVWDFPLLNVASAMTLSGDRIERIRIAVNAVAARPLRLPSVERAVTGKPRSAATGEMAGNLAVQGAVPLQFNSYKIPLMRNLVKRAIAGRQEATWTS